MWSQRLHNKNQGPPRFEGIKVIKLAQVAKLRCEKKATIWQVVDHNEYVLFDLKQKCVVFEKHFTWLLRTNGGARMLDRFQCSATLNKGGWFLWKASNGYGHMRCNDELHGLGDLLYKFYFYMSNVWKASWQMSKASRREIRKPCSVDWRAVALLRNDPNS